MYISRTCHGVDKEYCKMLVEAGYTAVDMNDTSYNNDLFLKSEEERFEFLSNAANNIRDCGLYIGQCHAPHAGSYWCMTPKEIEQRIVMIENCVKTVNKLNIPYTIIHPIVYAFNKQDENPERNWQMNIEMIKRICKYAVNTTICLENMPGVAGVIRTGEDLAKILNEIGDDNLAVCLDTGHLISQNESFTDFFAAVGNKVKTLHIHDSIPNQDLHLLVGSGKGDWEDFKQVLKHNNYQGTINSESCFVYHTPKQYRLDGQILERKILEELVK